MTFNPLTTAKTLVPFFGSTKRYKFISAEFGDIEFFNSCSILDVKPNPTSRIMQHPLENGSFVTDHAIENPTTLDIPMLLLSDDYPDIYGLLNLYKEKKIVFNVQTKVMVYVNQVITSIAHIESREILHGVALNLRTEQTRFLSPQYGVVPKYPSNGTTVSKGTVQGATASTGQKDAAITALERKIPIDR